MSYELEMLSLLDRSGLQKRESEVAVTVSRMETVPPSPGCCSKRVSATDSEYCTRWTHLPFFLCKEGRSLSNAGTIIALGLPGKEGPEDGTV